MVPLSILDLSPILEGDDAAQSLNNSRDLAALGEQLGYRRYWLAEHHNMPGIASAATAVVIGHVAAGVVEHRAQRRQHRRRPRTSFWRYAGVHQLQLPLRTIEHRRPGQFRSRRGRQPRDAVGANAHDNDVRARIHRGILRHIHCGIIFIPAKSGLRTHGTQTVRQPALRNARTVASATCSGLLENGAGDMP